MSTLADSENAAPTPRDNPPPPWITPQDLRRFRLLLDRTLGTGFRLAVVETPSVAAQQQAIDWLRGELSRRHAPLHDFDLLKYSTDSAISSGIRRVNFWRVLHDESAAGLTLQPDSVLVVRGFESLQDQRENPQWDVTRHFNIQRDLYVRDFPFFWILLLHPGSRQHWYKNAPDLCDFVTVWIETELVATPPGSAIEPDRSTMRTIESAAEASAPADWPELLRKALAQISAGKSDAALDTLHRFRATMPRDVQVSTELTIADLLECRWHRQRGQLDRADRALQRTLPLLQQSGDSPDAAATCKRDWAWGLDELGEIHSGKGNLQAARAAYEQSFALRQTLAAADETDIELQRDLSSSFNNLGDVSVAAGDLAGAKRWFEQGLAIRRKLAEADKTNAQLQRDLFVSFARLGDVSVAAGDLAAAKRWFEQSLVIARKLAEADKANAQLQRDLFVSFAKLGNVSVAAGDLAGAKRRFEQSLAIARKLAEADETNAQLKRDLSISFERLGNVSVAAGDLAGAKRWFEQCLAIRRILAEADKTNAQLQRDLSVSFEKLGEVSVAAGDLAGAKRLFEQGLAIRRQLAEADETNAQLQRDVAVSFAKLAELAERAGEDGEASVWWRQCLGVFDAMAARGWHISPGDLRFVESVRKKLG